MRGLLWVCAVFCLSRTAVKENLVLRILLLAGNGSFNRPKADAKSNSKTLVMLVTWRLCWCPIKETLDWQQMADVNCRVSRARLRLVGSSGVSGSSMTFPTSVYNYQRRILLWCCLSDTEEIPD